MLLGKLSGSQLGLLIGEKAMIMRACKCGCGEVVKKGRVFVDKSHQLAWMANGGAQQMNAMLSHEDRIRGGKTAGKQAAGSGHLLAASLKGAERSREIAEQVRKATIDAGQSSTNGDQSSSKTRWQHVGRLKIGLGAPLREAIESSLATMRITLRSLESQTYDSLKNASTPGGSVPLFLEGAPEPAIVEQSVLRDAYLSIVRAFVDFVDALLGFKNLTSSGIRVTRPLSGREAFEEYFQELRKQHTLEVARKQGPEYSSHAKVDKIASLSPEQKAMVTGYFLARAALEHHKGIPKQDIYLGYYALELFAKGRDLIEHLPYEATAGEILKYGITEKSRVLPAGKEIVLTEIEVNWIANTILLWLVPSLMQGLRPSTKTPNPLDRS